MPLAEAQAIRQQRIAALAVTLAGEPLDHPALTLEIGCGHGHYLTAYAAAHPDEHCLAIDIIKDRLDRAGRKSARAGLRNVSWIRAAAEEFIEALPPGVRFSRILVLFPDPWPKRRHAKNRLIQAPFLDRLAGCSRPGAQLCFRTDHAPYFEMAAEVIASHPDWAIASGAAWPFEHETVFAAKATGFQSLVAVRGPTRPIVGTAQGPAAPISGPG